MAVKSWLRKLKKGVVGETVRDYGGLTRDQDRVKGFLRRKGNQFRFVFSCIHHEHGKAEFRANVSAQTLRAMRSLVADIKALRKKNEKFKDFKLLFRDGVIDLKVTYHLDGMVYAPRQRSAPLNARTQKLLEEMLVDAETLLEHQLMLEED